MAFDSTISGPDANSYISVTEADANFELHLDGKVWNGLSTTDKEVYLASATTRLDMLKWGGTISDETQRLQWPRLYVRNRDFANEHDYVWGGTDTKYYYAVDEFPLELIQATCELAMYYYNREQENYTLSESDQEVFSKMNIGGVSLDIRDGLTVERLPTPVQRLLKAIGPNAWLAGQQTKSIRG